MLSGFDIVCVSPVDWGGFWGTMHQIMHRLARENRVLFVEEPVTMLAPLKAGTHWRRWRAVAPHLRTLEPGVRALTPPPLFPFGNMRRGVNRVNQAVLAGYVRWAMRRSGFGANTILWTYLPTSLDLLGLIPPPRLVVYHCVDEHSAFTGLIAPEVVRAYDDELTRRADLVITTADGLAQSRRLLNPHTHTVYNAADVALFNRALDPGLLVPADLAAIPAPRLVVVGYHDSWLDLDGLEILAEADPSWQVVLIGPVKAGRVDTPRLTRHATSICWARSRPKAFRGYLKGAAVGLIPFKASELTRNVFPLKFFEYLAAGLPVVAGGLPELRRFEGIVGVAEAPADYPELVRAAIGQDSPDRRAARVALAAANSWDGRVEEISALVEEALRRKAAGDRR